MSRLFTHVDVPLFRQEALMHQYQKQVGEVCVNTPVSYQLMCVGFGCIAVLLVIWMFWGDYAETFVVPGFIDTEHGIVRVASSKAGILSGVVLSPGDSVRQHDVLFRIDTSRDGFAADHKSRMYHVLLSRKAQIEQACQKQAHVLEKLKPLLQKKFIAETVYTKEIATLDSLKKERQDIQRDIIQYQQDSEYVIRAPINGTIASTHYQMGQRVTADQVLVKILPKNDPFIARVLIPMRQIGFIHPGMLIWLRYDAYPSERFGTYRGVIQNMSQTPVTEEDNPHIPIHVRQPYYSATVKLQSPSVQCFGQSHPLQHGLTLSAVIKGPTRKIWQWLLEPLYSFKGSLVS